MKKSLLIASLAFAVVACNKDNYQSKPQIKVTSGENVLVPIGSSLGMTLEFTDQEGDVDSVFVRKVRINKRQVPTLTARDTLKFKLPSFPPNGKGEIFLTFDYTNHLVTAQAPPPLPGGLTESDSLQFRIVVKDKAGNKSDTVYANNIIVAR